MNWENLCPNLNFTAENKMGTLHKAGNISTLTWWMRYSISSNFKNLLKNWVKYLQMLIMQISAQTDNDKYRRSVASKKMAL